MTTSGKATSVKTLLAMRSELVSHLFSTTTLDQLASLVDLNATRPITQFDSADPIELADVELLVTGWYAPHIGAPQLRMMPKLKAIVHAAGAVGFIDPTAWERGILVSTAAAANAVPVAEFTIAMITLAGKDAFWVSRDYTARREAIDRETELAHIGNYGRVVGIVGASRIGSRVLEMLRGYDVHALVYDPYCTPERAAELGAELVADLHELARRSSILSIHAPSLPATWELVSRSVLAALPDGATVINTARADIVDQAALLDELESGRLRAVLDVTDPEVPAPQHPFYSLANVFLTPHLAGAAGNELHRLGASAVAEVRRFVSGEQFAHPVLASDLTTIA